MKQMSFMSMLRRRVSRYIDFVMGADLRSLALFRVVLALVIISDLVVRSTDLVAHYTDHGVLPREFFFKYNLWYWKVSFHLLTGSAFGQALLFGIAGFFALLLLVGYRTRIVTMVSWVFLISLHVRNPLILNSGDLLLGMLLLLSIFLPLGARYSFDSALNTKPREVPTRIVSFATAAILLQVISLYWFSVLLKSGPEWRVDGTAVYYALNMDMISTPIGKFFLPFEGLLTVLTWGVLAFEIIGPALLLVPSNFVRVAAIAGFLAMHAGFGMFLSIGIFPWVAGLLSMIFFLPTRFWEYISQICTVPLARQASLYYDAECGFCERSVRLLQTFLFLPASSIFHAQNFPAMYEVMQCNHSWIVTDSVGRIHSGFDAFCVLVKASPVFYICAPIFSLSWVFAVGSYIYRRISSNRKLWGWFFSFLHFRPLRLQMVRWENFFVFSLITLILFLNAGDFIEHREIGDHFAILFHVRQQWAMFAPSPRKIDGWHVIVGHLADGQEIDLLRNGKRVSWERPEDFSEIYRNQHWRKYLERVTTPHEIYTVYGYVGDYLCYNWNKNSSGQEKRLSGVSVYFMKKTTLPNYQYIGPEKISVFKHSCVL